MSDHLEPGASPAQRTLHFEEAIWPHLAAAYNFARWLVHNHHDAEDIAQESFVKAFKSAETFRGTDVRPWLFAIVRNSAINFLSRHKQEQTAVALDGLEPLDSAPNPELSLAQERRRQQVRAAIGRLPLEFREALLLREMEGMSYKEIAYVQKVALGTVMSRLSRARALLVDELVVPAHSKQEGSRI